MSSRSPIILAIDTSELEVAQSWIQATQGYVAGYKLGLEFFMAFGSVGVQKLMDGTDAALFLDLKLHDIPNTVAAATKAVSDLAPRFLTVHASGGKAMITAAVEAAPMVEVTAVTILTSLSQADLLEIGYAGDPVTGAVRLALLAQKAGARAVVCSPQEVSAIRVAVGPEMTIITPGVRPSNSAGSDDQRRTMDAKSAMEAGATFLVIGRPITSFWTEGLQAMRDRTMAIADELN